MNPTTVNHETVTTLLKYYKTPAAVRSTVESLTKQQLENDMTTLLLQVQKEAGTEKIADSVRDLFFIYATKFLHDEQNRDLG